jgi:1,2-dihydroxy-3-keto-5-methylthiopentene dioxygenase
MSKLVICTEKGDVLDEIHSYRDIAARLSEIGVLFERWEPKVPVSEEDDESKIMEAFREDIQRLMDKYGFKSCDVVSLTPDNPKKDELRKKFLEEHTHSDFEVRYFVYGDGVFYLHPDDKVYIVHCEGGDLISVPPNTPHWFDMGDRPNFKCIRLFTTPEGWVANYTGSDIASRFPKYEGVVSGAV